MYKTKNFKSNELLMDFIDDNIEVISVYNTPQKYKIVSDAYYVNDIGDLADSMRLRFEITLLYREKQKQTI